MFYEDHDVTIEAQNYKVKVLAFSFSDNIRI